VYGTTRGNLVNCRTHGTSATLEWKGIPRAQGDADGEEAFLF